MRLMSQQHQWKHKTVIFLKAGEKITLNQELFLP